MDRVTEVPLPDGVRAQSTLERVDYEDCFLVDVDAGERTAEEWLRAMVEDAPASTRASLRRGWAALGLKVGPEGSDRHVLGWELRRSTPDLVLVGMDSRVGMPAELLAERRDGRLLFSTLVHHGNPAARILWSRAIPFGHFHRDVVARLLARAARNSARVPA